MWTLKVAIVVVAIIGGATQRQEQIVTYTTPSQQICSAWQKAAVAAETPPKPGTNHLQVSAVFPCAKK